MSIEAKHSHSWARLVRMVAALAIAGLVCACSAGGHMSVN